MGTWSPDACEVALDAAPIRPLPGVEPVGALSGALREHDAGERPLPFGVEAEHGGGDVAIELDIIDLGFEAAGCGVPPHGERRARVLFATASQVEAAPKQQMVGVERMGPASLPLHAITRDRVNRWFDTYSATAPGGANHALANLSQILNHAIACGHIESHSLRAVRRNPRTPLIRFLSQEEIGRLHRVLDEYRDARPALRQQADVIRLLLLTGCRKREIANLRWSEVSGDSLKLTDSKTGPRTVYLNAQARTVLERQPHGLSPFVFPSPRDPSRPTWAELPLWWSVRKKAGIDDVRLHDLRHSFASHADLQGVPLPVVSRLLGHTRLQMTLRYAHVADREVEAAAERVGEAIAGLLTPA